MTDVHIDFEVNSYRTLLNMIEIKLDTLFVLGDISQDIDEVYEFLDECSKRWEGVYFILGNHELRNPRFKELYSDPRYLCNNRDLVRVGNKKVAGMTAIYDVDFKETNRLRVDRSKDCVIPYEDLVKLRDDEFAYYNRVKDEFDILLTHIALKESTDFSQFRVEVCAANRAIEINKNQVHINGHDHQEKLTGGKHLSLQGGQEATGFKRDVHTIIY